MRGRTTRALAGALLVALAGPAGAEVGELRLEIYEPSDGRVLEDSRASLEVEGGASIFGGVRQLDLVFVLDRSKSLRRTDPQDFRAAGALGLVENLSPTSDIRIGVVAFDWDAELRVPLTSDRRRVLQGLRDLDRRGGTDLADGLREALETLESDARPDATRVVLLFTDGKSDEDDALEAMAEVRERGVVIHTLGLGSDRDGTKLLAEIAEGTGGSFVQVTDPARLPEAFLDLRTTGVDRVTLSVNGSEPQPVRLVGGRFREEVPLRQGENRIVARAVALDGRTREHAVRVVVRPPGCGELQVEARRDGAPAVSLAERAVQIVLDASNSMWGRLDGSPKISVAQQTLGDALDWLPRDLRLGLRVYGHRQPFTQRDCQDSELLAAPSPENRSAIRTAISGLRPRGQTPLAYSIDQVSADFGRFAGERAVVLVTDGIESCGGDPVDSARRLQQGRRLPIHVIGFGLGSRVDEDEAQLRGIAEASGGRFLTAANAEELREALAEAVGTPFRVFHGEDWVASGALGAGGRILLPPGEYLVRFETTPLLEAPVTLASEESRTLTVMKEQEEFSTVQVGRRAPYASCEQAVARAPASFETSVEPGLPAAAAPEGFEAEVEPAPASVPERGSFEAAAEWPHVAPTTEGFAAAAEWPHVAPATEGFEAAAEPGPPASLEPGGFEAPLEPAPPAAPAPEGFEAADIHVAGAALDALRDARLDEADATEQRPWLSLAAGQGTIDVWEDPERDAPWLVVVTHPRLATGTATVWSGHDAEVARQVAQGVRETLQLALP